MPIDWKNATDAEIIGDLHDYATEQAILNGSAKNAHRTGLMKNVKVHVAGVELQDFSIPVVDDGRTSHEIAHIGRMGLALAGMDKRHKPSPVTNQIDPDERPGAATVEKESRQVRRARERRERK